MSCLADGRFWSHEFIRELSKNKIIAATLGAAKNYNNSNGMDEMLSQQWYANTVECIIIIN